VPTPFCGVAMSSASSLSGKGTSGPRPDPIWAQTVRISEKDANRRYDVECIHCLEAVSADASFSVRAWWLAVGNAAAETVALALFLFDIVPHAGTTERTFSTMGWFDSPRRNRLHVASLAMMTSIRSNLLQQVPR
jgi:hypothetical protein